MGFACGYELRPTTYYSWLYGVLPDARRLGVATQLLVAETAWARDRGYEMARFECYNQHKPMLLLAIRAGYEIVGLRHDSHTANNLVILEKHLHKETVE
ncbi:MAG: GNAT family N-acetyltransferase [bacterium]|nr:GNAT family N-acetyltransferase [bacterium]